MKKFNISRWKSVFSFTLKQQMKGKGFKVTTTIVGLLFFVVVFAILMISSKLTDGNEGIQDSEIVEKGVTHVLILDETNPDTDLLSVLDSYESSPMKDIRISDYEFQALSTESSVEEGIEATSEYDDNAVVLHITEEEEGTLLKVVIPEDSFVIEEEGEILLDILVPLYEHNQILESGLTDEQLSSISRSAVTSITTVGEEPPGFAEEFIKYMVPMLFAMILYFMLLLYGQTIIKSLMVEKTSKLMEMLLTTIPAKAIIVGKILAMSFLAIFQFLIWILCGILGFLTAGGILKLQNPNYENPLTPIIQLVQMDTQGSAFSVPAIIVAIIALCLGFLFYTVYAGLLGSALAKAEDVSSGVALYQIPVIVCGLSAMMLPATTDGFLARFIEYFPFTAPFMLPSNLLIGNMKLIPGLISLLILIATLILLIVIASRLYKGLIFFKGDKLKLKNIIQVLKGVN